MNDLQNELILDNFVSITKIHLSGDLSYCKVYITSSAEEKINNNIVDNLNISKNQIRYLLGKRIEMRKIPELVFKEDKIMNEGLSVLNVLNQLRVKNKNKNKS